MTVCNMRRDESRCTGRGGFFRLITRRKIMSDSDRMMIQIGNCRLCGSMHITIPAVSQYKGIADNCRAVTGSGCIFYIVFCKGFQASIFMLVACAGFYRDPGNLQPVINA